LPSRCHGCPSPRALFKEFTLERGRTAPTRCSALHTIFAFLSAALLSISSCKISVMRLSSKRNGMSCSCSHGGMIWSNSCSSYERRLSETAVSCDRERLTSGIFFSMRFLVRSSRRRAPPRVLNRSGPFRLASNSCCCIRSSTHSSTLGKICSLLDNSDCKRCASSSCSCNTSSLSTSIEWRCKQIIGIRDVESHHIPS
jgi:hypothetical protein